MSPRDVLHGCGPVLKGRTVLTRSLAAVGALALALATSVATLPLAAAVPAAEAATVSPVVATQSAVTIDDIAPLTVTPTDTVTVRATVRNTGPDVIAEPTASLSVVRYRLQSRTQLRDWFADELTLPAATRLTTTTLEEPLGPGESRQVELSVPAEELRLLPYPEASGPRGIVVELDDSRTGAVASARSFLLWFPQGAAQAVRLSVLVPVTGPAATPGDPEAWSASMAAAVAPSGRLARILAATAGVREVSWVVDPALMDAAAAGVGGAEDWGSSLLASASRREVFALDPFDPDIAALAAADVPPFQRGASARSDARVRGWRDDLALPAPGTASERTLAAAVAAGDSLAVVDGGLEPTTPTTPNGVVPVGTDSGTVRALVPDAGLGELFATATPTNRQLLLAELAVIAQEQPGRTSHVLVATDRGWDPDVAATSALLGSLVDAPFVNLQPVATLAGAQPDDVPRADLPDADTPRAALSPRLLRTAADQLADVTALAGVVPDPDAVTASYTRDLAAATSVAAGESRGLARKLLEAATAQGDELLGGITVLPGSTVNLINESGAIPITVRNDLPQPATVTVALLSRESRLSVDDVRETTVEPGGTSDVQIPVRAIGSGDVRVTVQIRAADGTVVAAPSEMTVRVRAGWETVGTAIIGGLLVVLLVGGIVRTVRRGRSSRRMEPIRPSDPDENEDEPARKETR